MYFPTIDNFDYRHGGYKRVDRAIEYMLDGNSDFDKIISISCLGPSSHYVYDLETANNHFSAGIGQIVVHNTDSVMVNLNIKDRKECQYWGERLAQEISGVKAGDPLPFSTEKHSVDRPGLFLKPLEMEFEKAMLLFCIKPKMYAAYLISSITMTIQ